MPKPQTAEGIRAYELDQEYVFHSWSAQKGRDPIVMDHGAGPRLWDADGNEYLDFSSQLVYTNIGHQHPVVIQAIADQASRLCTVAPGHVAAARSEAARLVAEHAPDSFHKVFFTNGGAESTENAIRLARLYTGRYRVLSRHRSYHGSTETAMNVSGDPRGWSYDHGSSGTVHFFGPYLYRSPWNSTTEEEECQRALQHLEDTISFSGPDQFAALILETIPGTAGIIMPPPEYYKGVRDICDRYGIVLIFDEVMVGFGRMGNWFALDRYGVEPDLITFAKGVTSGYVPMGGVIIGDRIAHAFDQNTYPGGMTYSGHPLAAAAAVATMTAMEEERMVENSAELGEQLLGPRLAEMKQAHPVIGDLRGAGCYWALDLVRGGRADQPLAPFGGGSQAMRQILAKAVDEHLLIFSNTNRLHVAPPINISRQDAELGLAKLDRVLDFADRFAA